MTKLRIKNILTASALLLATATVVFLGPLNEEATGLSSHANIEMHSTTASN